MKFSDPKTGETSENIGIARKEFCYRTDNCEESPIGCSKFVQKNPTEAARLMGYEVIEDGRTCKTCKHYGGGYKCNFREYTVQVDPKQIIPCSAWEAKEDNMEKNKPLSEWTLKEAKDYCTKYWKEHGCDGCLFRCADNECAIEVPSEWGIPSESSSAAEDTDTHCKPAKPRLAEVLGVEVGETFKVEGVSVRFFVSEDGMPKIYDGDSGLDVEGMDIYKAINHPESIIRGPRLTEPEIAIMRAVEAKWASRNEDSDYGFVELWQNKPLCIEENFASGDGTPPIASVLCSLFPSVEPGDCIELEDI